VARAMHNVVLKQMKVVLQENKFISISCDEITTMDNQFGFLCMPMSLKIGEGNHSFLILKKLWT
jgi:hypothetical protein